MLNILIIEILDLFMIWSLEFGISLVNGGMGLNGTQW